MFVVVIGVLVELGEPDDLLRVDTFAVDDSGDLSIGAACIKTNAAAIHIPAHGLRLLVGGRAAFQRKVENLQLLLVHLLDEGVVKLTLTCGGVGLLELLCQLRAAADGNLEPADGPQQELHIPLHIAVVSIAHLGSAVDEGAVDGDAAPIPFHGDGNGLLRVLQVGFPPYAEGDKGFVQLGGMLHLIFNT